MKYSWSTLANYWCPAQSVVGSKGGGPLHQGQQVSSRTKFTQILILFKISEVMLANSVRRRVIKFTFKARWKIYHCFFQTLFSSLFSQLWFSSSGFLSNIMRAPQFGSHRSLALVPWVPRRCAHYDCDALWIQNFQDGGEGREISQVICFIFQ